ncbi:MAG: hypothetical protein QOH25_1366 [Acidobacteriota bacterium]|jgi:hypothetical protein|nr:hypothetical protein [Acidobacteriota bacterium]
MGVEPSPRSALDSYYLEIHSLRFMRQRDFDVTKSPVTIENHRRRFFIQIQIRELREVAIVLERSRKRGAVAV